MEKLTFNTKIHINVWLFFSNIWTICKYT